jgi:hypothetical protein
MRVTRQSQNESECPRHGRRDEGEGETYLSSLIESGRHGFEIEGGTTLRIKPAHLAMGGSENH